MAGPYSEALVEAGKIDEASALAGRVAAWSERDMRSALIEARVYDAMQNPARVARRAADPAAVETILRGCDAATRRSPLK